LREGKILLTIHCFTKVFVSFRTARYSVLLNAQPFLSCRGLDLMVLTLQSHPPKRGVLRATPPYQPKGCTRAGQNTSRVLLANAMSDSS
jgi:hypothetical protein